MDSTPQYIKILQKFKWLKEFLFLELFMSIWSWSANSIEPCQTAWMCRLALLYTFGKG